MDVCGGMLRMCQHLLKHHTAQDVADKACFDQECKSVSLPVCEDKLGVGATVGMDSIMRLVSRSMSVSWKTLHLLLQGWGPWPDSGPQGRPQALE